jgi:hypothetical protein
MLLASIPVDGIADASFEKRSEASAVCEPFRES